MDRAQLAARLESEVAMLGAQQQTCEHSLHASPVGCPYCRRDARLTTLLTDAANLLATLERNWRSMQHEAEYLRKARDEFMRLWKADRVRVPTSPPEALREPRADALRDAVCQILSATGSMQHEIPSIAIAALERDNEFLDSEVGLAAVPSPPGDIEEPQR